MTDLEERLRKTLARQADTVTTTSERLDPRIDGVDSIEAHGRPRWLYGAVAASLVVLAIGLATATTQRTDGTLGGVDTGSTPKSLAPTLPVTSLETPAATEPPVEAAVPSTTATPSTVTTSQGAVESSGVTVSAPTAAGVTQDEIAAGEVRLWVSNQSFDEDPAAITIRIDGQVVVNGPFAVGSQHNWMSFDIQGLSSGVHELVAESDSGTRTNGSFTLPDGESRWLVADYWYDTNGPENHYFILSESDEPVYFR